MDKLFQQSNMSAAANKFGDDLPDLIKKAKAVMLLNSKKSHEYKQAEEFLKQVKEQNEGKLPKNKKRTARELESSDSDSSEDSGSGSDSSSDEGEATTAKASSSKAEKQTSRKRSRPATEPEDDDVVFSDNDNSQKKWLRGMEKSVGKGKKKSHDAELVKRKFKTITKNYAPEEQPDNQHKYYFRAFIGGGFHVSLAKWLRNKQKYIQIRKSTTGANIPVSQYQHLKNAILDMERLCPKELLGQPKIEDDSSG